MSRHFIQNKMDKFKNNKILFFAVIAFCVIFLIMCFTYLIISINSSKGNLPSGKLTILYKSFSKQQSQQIVEGEGSTISSTVITVSFAVNNPKNVADTLTINDFDLKDPAGNVYSPVDFSNITVAPVSTINLTEQYILVSDEKQLTYDYSQKQTINL